MKPAARASFRDIKAEMLHRIATRVWPPGSLIPGEEALAQEFGAARATVNRAVQELARSGLVERKRKAGTRVALHPIREARLAIPLVRREIEANGAVYGYRLLLRESGSAPAQVTDRLGLPLRKNMLQVRCLHLADGAPYQFEQRWIDPDTVPAVRDERFEAVGPNEWLVENAPFSRAEFSFLADRASAEEAAALSIEAGEAVLVAERATWLLTHPITLVRMVHRPGHRMVTEL
jgi:GntR family histidine utilization transcriptional repressor